MNRLSRLNITRIIIVLGVLSSMIALLTFILYLLGQSSIFMHLAKQECIAECIEFNKNAIKLGLNQSCVC